MILCLLGVVSSFMFSSVAHAQAPLNDECAGAISLSVNNDLSSNFKNDATLGYATQSRIACLNYGYPAKDAWYKFVATSAVHNITLNPLSSNDFVFEVFKGTCDNLTSIACVNASGLEEIEVTVVKNLTPGETYYIRVYNLFGDASPTRQFSIRININPATIPNDECSGAVNIPITQRSGGKRYTNIGATLSMPACSGVANNDIWFKFTATAPRHRIYAEGNSGINPVVIEVFKGDCSNLTSIKCYSFKNHLVDLTSLILGETYYYRVYFSNGSNLRTDIYTEVSDPGPPPANDECGGAVSLPVNNDNSSTLSYNTTLGMATESMVSCANSGAEANDVWFKFVAIATTHNITLSPTSSNDFAFQVFKGTCLGLVSLECVNKTGYNEKEATVVNNLVIGETYFIRVYNWLGDATPTRTFNLCINTSTTVIPNDECTGAINVPITGRNEGGKYTNLGATLSLPPCKGTANNDIWFRFTATKSRHRISVSAEEGNNPMVIQVYKGTCSNLISILCYDYPSRLADLSNLTPGETYYYRIYFSNGSNLRTNIYTDVSVSELPPVNDECQGAISLPVNNDNSTTLSYNSTLAFASESLPACINYGYEANDTWYKFVATAATHNITLTPISSDDFVFQVFKGGCGTLISQDCVNKTDLQEREVTVVNSLVVGETYYIRVYNKYGDATPSRNFNLCINTSATTIPNDECAGAINIPIGEPDYNLKYTNVGATLSMPACSGTANNDMWFKFTATSTRHQVSAYASSGELPVFIQVYKGNCSGLTSILCYDYGNGLADLSDLTVGNTYYYRIYISQGSSLRTDFVTYIRGPLPPPSKPTLAANTLQCTADTLKVNVSGVAAGNTIRGFLNGTPMKYDEAKALIWEYPNPVGSNTVKAIQVTPQNNTSDTAIITVTTNTSLTASAILSSAVSRICAGNSLELTASVVNGGTNPVLKWLVNDKVVQTGGNTYISVAFREGDKVAVTAISNQACVLNGEVFSNVLTLKVDPVVITAGVVHSPERICASGNYTVNVTASNTPLRSTVELFEATGAQAKVSLGVQTFSGTVLTWNINAAHVKAEKKYFARIVPPADVQCVQGSMTDTTLTISEAVLVKPEISRLNSVLEIANYDPASTYNWQIKSDASWSNIEGQNKKQLEIRKGGTYRVTIQKGSCNNVSNEILVSESVQVKLYPNPASEFVYVGPLFDVDQWQKVEIVGANGRRYIVEDISGQAVVAIKISHLPKGAYILNLYGKTGNKLNRKFMKL